MKQAKSDSMVPGRLVDRIRKLAQDARKDGHEAYASSLFDIAEEVEREPPEVDGEVHSVGIPLEFASEAKLLDHSEIAAGDLGRILDVLRVDRIVLERSSQVSSMERNNGEDEEGA